MENELDREKKESEKSQRREKEFVVLTNEFYELINLCFY